MEKIITTRKCYYAFLFCLVMIIVSNNCLALSKDELVSYGKAMSMAIEETYLGIEPGTLDKAPLSQEEKQKRSVDMARRVMQSTKSSLEIYERFYGNMTKRMMAEIKINDQSLAEWHRKLTLGFKDSHEITADALIAESMTDLGLRQKAFEDKQIYSRIRKNAVYHHNLRNELQKVIMPLIPDGKEQREFIIRTGVNQYIERTWK